MKTYVSVNFLIDRCHGKILGCEPMRETLYKTFDYALDRYTNKEEFLQNPIIDFHLNFTDDIPLFLLKDDIKSDFPMNIKNRSPELTTWVEIDGNVIKCNMDETVEVLSWRFFNQFFNEKIKSEYFVSLTKDGSIIPENLILREAGIVPMCHLK